MKDFQDLEIIDAIEPSADIVSFSEIEKSLIQILKHYSEVHETVSLGAKWTGGTVVLKPGSKELKEKEIPIDAFFHKIVLVRNRLRTLEQRVNSSNLNDEEKVNIHLLRRWLCLKEPIGLIGIRGQMNLVALHLIFLVLPDT